jgi:hypothetical protein
VGRDRAQQRQRPGHRDCCGHLRVRGLAKEERCAVYATTCPLSRSRASRS